MDIILAKSHSVHIGYARIWAVSNSNYKFNFINLFQELEAEQEEQEILNLRQQFLSAGTTTAPSLIKTPPTPSPKVGM